MDATESPSLHDARKMILGWPFITLATSMLGFWISFSLAIGEPEEIIGLPGSLYFAFGALVCAVLFLGTFFFLIEHTDVKDRSYWLGISGFCGSMLAAVCGVIYRYHTALLSISPLDGLIQLGWSALGVLGIIAGTKLALWLILGKKYS